MVRRPYAAIGAKKQARLNSLDSQTIKRADTLPMEMDIIDWLMGLLGITNLLHKQS